MRDLLGDPPGGRLPFVLGCHRPRIYGLDRKRRSLPEAESGAKTARRWESAWHQKPIQSRDTLTSANASSNRLGQQPRGWPILTRFLRKGGISECELILFFYPSLLLSRLYFSSTLGAMPKGLRRYYGHEYLHFLTCSCYHRQRWLASEPRRNLFLEILEQARQR